MGIPSCICAPVVAGNQLLLTPTLGALGSGSNTHMKLIAILFIGTALTAVAQTNVATYRGPTAEYLQAEREHKALLLSIKAEMRTNPEAWMKELQQKRVGQYEKNLRTGFERNKFGIRMPAITNEAEIKRLVNTLPKYKVVTTPHGRQP